MTRLLSRPPNSGESEDNMKIDYTNCTKEELIIYRIFDAIKVFGKENFYKSNNFVILDVTGQYEDQYGNKINGKYIPTMYKNVEKTAEEMAEAIYKWLQHNLVIPEHGGVLMAESSWETQHCHILTPDDRACSIIW